MTNVRTVEVQFGTDKTALLRARKRTVPQTYTYLLPDSADVSVGDTVVVPVGRYGQTSRAVVTAVGEIDYKYIIGKVVNF